MSYILSTFWLAEPICTGIWSEKVPDLSHLVPIWPTLGDEETSGMVGLAPKWVRLAPNGTNPVIFSDQIQYFRFCTVSQNVLSLIWNPSQNVLNLIWKKSPDLDLKRFRLTPNYTYPGIFFLSDLVHFGSPSQNVLNLILKSPRIVPFGANLTKFWASGTSLIVFSMSAVSIFLQSISYIKCYQNLQKKKK